MPGAFTAYRYTSGELMMGEYAWLSEHFECDGLWEGEAQEVEEVVMVPVVVRTFPCHETPPEGEE